MDLDFMQKNCRQSEDEAMEKRVAKSGRVYLETRFAIDRTPGKFRLSRYV